MGALGSLIVGLFVGIFSACFRKLKTKKGTTIRIAILFVILIALIVLAVVTLVGIAGSAGQDSVFILVVLFVYMPLIIAFGVRFIRDIVAVVHDDFEE